jgi:hypothetical protein
MGAHLFNFGRPVRSAPQMGLIMCATWQRAANGKRQAFAN